MSLESSTNKQATRSRAIRVLFHRLAGQPQSSTPAAPWTASTAPSGFRLPRCLLLRPTSDVLLQRRDWACAQAMWHRMAGKIR